MIDKYIGQLVLPQPGSHKGQNGKLLVIGGSELFHAPLLWAAEVASRVVDMVHVTSPEATNRLLMKERLKRKFWNGIVVDWEDVSDYIVEDDAILIGPGMTRSATTKRVVDELLAKFPGKRWVVDGGALQMVNPDLLNGKMIITPHQKEWEQLLSQKTNFKFQISNNVHDTVKLFSKYHENLTILLKGQTDIVCRGNELIEVGGGNPGMTKGGTGDVLAGLVGALVAGNDLLVAAVVASQVNKMAGDRLGHRVGNFYNATDLMAEIPYILREITG